MARERDGAVAGVYPHVGVDRHQPVPVKGVLHQVGHIGRLDNDSVINAAWRGVGVKNVRDYVVVLG